MTQADLFAPPPEAPRCGNCVVRNAIDESAPFGGCSRLSRQVATDEPACDQWYGLAQLRAPIYGRKAA